MKYMIKAIEIIVPRNLIKGFYQHPEPSYGDGYFIVVLINDMYTDVYYREEGDFGTITNDKELVSYLRKNKSKSRKYFFRNGVYSLRNVQDCDDELIEKWKNISPISIRLEIPISHNLPSEFMFCLYWREVGKAEIEENIMTLNVYEKDLIHMKDIGVLLDLLIEDSNETNSL